MHVVAYTCHGLAGIFLRVYIIYPHINLLETKKSKVCFMNAAVSHNWDYYYFYTILVELVLS